MNLGSLLTEHRLHINSSLEESLINLFCSTKTIGSRKRLLENWFEGYIYCASLGLAHDRRRPFEKGEKSQKAQWSSSYISQYEYLLCQVLARQDVMAELGLWTVKKDVEDFDIISSIKERYTDDAEFDVHLFYKKVLQEAKNICDEYMNGGLEILQEKRNEGLIFTDELDTLVKLFKRQ